MNAARAGKWAAAALFSFVAVLILIAAAAELSKRKEQTRQTIELSGEQFQVLADPSGPPAEWVDPASMGDAASALGMGEAWTWHSPAGRIQYELTAERVDPEESGRIRLTEPRARFFLGDRIVRVTAAQGVLVKPANAAPESGTLSGGVLMEMFEVGDVGTSADAAQSEQSLDLDAMTPIGTLRTKSFDFESALGQISTRDEIEVESDGVSFRGRGLTLRVAESKAEGEKRRYSLNLLRIDESSGLRVRPAALQRESEHAEERDEDATGHRKGAGDKPNKAEPAPIEDFYRATIQGDVNLAQGPRRISAERLMLFARTLNGTLAPGAIRSLTLPEPPGAPAPAPEKQRRWSASFREGEAPASDPTTDEVTLTWTGPLEVQPEKSRPAELARDDVLIWFASPKKNVVEITDGATGAEARCASMMYAATTARLMLNGAASTPNDVRIAAPNVGEVVGEGLEVELANLPAGVVRMASPGVARARADTPEVGVGGGKEGGGAGGGQPGAIRWKDSASIAFEVVRVGEDLSVQPRSITMKGDVHAQDGANAISADSIQAGFSTRNDTAGQPATAISRLELKGRVRGASEDGGTLTADEADIDFAGPADAPRPIEARAHGAVRVERAGDWLSAEHVDAKFATDAQAGLRVSALDADTGVALGSSRGLGATTEQLRADLDHQLVELTGDSTELSYQHDETRYALHASSMRLDGETRRLVAFGRGDATFRLAGQHAVADSGRMEWTGGMYYDDIAGTADMLGDVVASRVPGPFERQHAEAGQVRISLTPWSSESQADDVGERHLLAIDLEGEAEAPALLELRRYRESLTDEAELETLVALRSETIKFDAVGEVLDAPDAGLLLVEDRRRGEVREGQATSDVGQETEVRGTTAFEWKDGLTFTRPTGEATMKRDVRVRHMGLETGRLTQLECESLIAHFRKPGEEIEGESPLLSVDATDGVYLHHATIEVVGDALAFDAINEQIVATAGAGNRVTVLDSGDGRHFTAETIEVNLKTGQWRAAKATGIGLSK